MAQIIRSARHAAAVVSSATRTELGGYLRVGSREGPVTQGGNEAFSPEPEIMIWGILFRGGVRRLWLGNLGPVDDPQPGAIGLAAQDLDSHAGVVGRAGRGQRQVLEPDGGQGVSIANFTPASTICW